MKRISIIILTHERLPELKECLASIFQQKYMNTEIIIIDDSRDEKTKDYINELNEKRIIYERRSAKESIGEKRRLAYLKATGDYVIFIDDDDYYTDYKYFKKLVKTFNENDEIDIIVSDTNVFYENDGSISRYSLDLPEIFSARDYYNHFQCKYKKPTSTLGLAVRGNILDDAGFGSLHSMNDTAIYLNALAVSNKVYYNSDAIGNYRIHESNISKSVKADIIIEQLIEKKRLYEKTKKKISFPKKKWLYQQVLITAKYYANGREKNKDDRKRVTDYIRKNIGFLPYVYTLIACWKKDHEDR